MKSVLPGIVLSTLSVFLSVPSVLAQDRSSESSPMTQRPMSVEDLFAFKRLAAPSISPDGQWVAWAASEITDSKNNKSVSRIWLAPADGSFPARQLTNPAAKDNSPKWSPDGRWLLFESTRSGSSQLWVISAAGGEARQLTTISTGASTAMWSPDGQHIAFVSTVYPEFSTKPFAESDKLNKEKTEAIEASPVKARVFKRLFYRHWDSYVEDKRQHLFVIDLSINAAGDLVSVEGNADAGRTEEQRSYQVSNELYFSELRFRGEQKCYQRATAHLVIAFFPAPDTIGLVIQSSSYSGCGCTLEFSFNGTTVRRFVARWCTVHIVTRPLLLYCTVPHNKCLRRLNASRMSFFVHRYYVFIVVYCIVKTNPARWVNYTTAVKPWLRSPLLESLINIDSWG